MMTDLYKPFEITSVCRGDIVQILMDDEASEEEAVKIADSFTDAEMERLAERMADSYVGWSNQFWIDLDIITEDILDDREED
jgi:hypothetical protein